MATKNRWLVSTNTKTMSMIIAQGLISSPDGFKKYYLDALNLCHGWIPIFKNHVPSNIIEYGISEREGLIPCIIEFHISIIIGTVKIIKDNGLVDIEIENLDKEGVDIAFLSAPLPLASIAQILFKSVNDMKQFENDAILRSNVILSGITLQSRVIDQKLFSIKASTTDLPLEYFSTLELSHSIIDYNKVYAFGGMMAMLFYYTKNGMVSHTAFTSSLATELDTNSHIDYTTILNYFYNPSSNIADSDATKKTYNNLIDVAINRKDFKEAVIEFLESYASSFANKLQIFESKSDKPISEEFSEAKTVLQKSILMLFLREDTEALIDYNLDIFTEEHYVNFAMLFGIRDKFIKIPKFIREFKDFQHFISSLMANYANRMIKSKIKFKVSRQPLTVMAMLNNDRFKEYFAKELKIENCFQTIMPKTDYIVMKGKPVFEGVIMPKFELLEEKYFQSISKTKLTDYNKYVEKYEKIK